MTVTIDRNELLWKLENIPTCSDGMEIVKAFLEAAGECVNRLGIGRTSSTRAALLTALNAMERHGDGCERCDEMFAGLKASTMASRTMKSRGACAVY
jgi:hypothetical protein